MDAVGPSCPAQAGRTPGWAAVQVTTATTAYRAHRSDYRLNEVHDSSTVDGEMPRTSWDASSYRLAATIKP